jgi:hypothetical protein
MRIQNSDTEIRGGRAEIHGEKQRKSVFTLSVFTTI